MLTAKVYFNDKQHKKTKSKNTFNIEIIAVLPQ